MSVLIVLGWMWPFLWISTYQLELYVLIDGVASAMVVEMAPEMAQVLIYATMEAKLHKTHAKN